MSTSALPASALLTGPSSAAAAAGNGSVVGGVSLLGAAAVGDGSVGTDGSGSGKMQSLGDGESADQVRRICVCC